MPIVSSTDGSPTSTGWKRRASAASFSMCLRYSSSVVAPIARSSPRASIGFSRFAASTAPSAAPAPTIVCSSSMNSTTWPSAAVDLAEHGLQPLLELAAVLGAGEQRAHVERPRRGGPSGVSGTSPETIRWARPSMMAVLPTPGSPISTGLFFVRRESTWTMRRISSSRPITGSSLPASARAGQVDRELESAP